jgi:hypothetical protein
MACGAIELGGAFGGYEIDSRPASSMPEVVASAIVEATSNGVLGVILEPLWYIGSQLVNGTNYLLVCKATRSTYRKDTAIVLVTINVPPSGAVDGSGATIVSIKDEADLTPELEVIFNTAMMDLVGVEYKPVAYVGKQVVKGINYYFICEAKGVYPGAEPYAALVCINVFGCAVSVPKITPIPEPDQNNFNSPLGEWP